MIVASALNIEKIRGDFPILKQQVNGKPLVYFDNGATTQKPKQVIEAIVKYYTEQNANIHRGVHTLSQVATQAFEDARIAVQKFINASSPNEIIFTKGTTEAINLVASTIETLLPSPAGEGLGVRPEILITQMEHHSNILPWQKLCKEIGAILKVVPVNENGELDIEAFKKLVTPKTRLVAFTHVSNTLGTINPVKELIKFIRTIPLPAGGGARGGALVLVDGAQAVPHLKVDVQNLDADFYCFSAHKMYGPTGIGVLYVKENILNKLSNYQVGGGTIKTVTFDKTEYVDGPLRFEAGTPDMAGAVGLKAAIDYMNEVGIETIEAHEHELLTYATEKLKTIEGLSIIGDNNHKAGVISFVIEGLHPLDIGTILDKQGMAVRTGHHCTQPLMDKFSIPGTVRVSFGMYNTVQEIDKLIEGINKAVKMLK